METNKEEHSHLRNVTFILILCTLIVGLLAATFFKNLPSIIDRPQKTGDTLSQFKTSAEFQKYISQASKLSDTSFFGLAERSLDTAANTLEAVPQAAPERVSQTNTQVAGIDEPDIIKTDGQRIFFSEDPLYYIQDLGIRAEPATDVSVFPPPDLPQQNTKVINAFPIENLSEISEIGRQGDLLLSDGTLVVLSGNKVYGYDVTNPDSPQETWSLNFDQNSIVDARLKSGDLYLVVSTNIRSGAPCPMPLYANRGNRVTIPCTDIYYPGRVIPTNATYTAISLNPKTGEEKNKISFVGSSNSSVVYMSDNALYITYSPEPDLASLYYNFLASSGAELIPSTYLTRIKTIQDYDISSQSKLNEINLIMEEYRANLPENDKLTFNQNFQNGLSEYLSQHLRGITSTGIIKIGLSNLSIDATGKVAGTPLNQFSLDEYDGNLRIATTSTLRGFLGDVDSVNDVYVLDTNLATIGSVVDLGITEQIFSARFIGDRGYVVTFRQIDPFYVLDLSNPRNPRMAGELKIPGYSSYLHQLEKNRILGIGKEGNFVKLSLFDVSQPNNPQEIDKFSMSEYWSEVLNNHRAFLNDDRHKIFFIPGGQGGYIFSYENNSLTLVQSISGIGVKRALYIDDYLYVIGQEKIVVLNEENWDTENELLF